MSLLRLLEARKGGGGMMLRALWVLVEIFLD